MLFNSIGFVLFLITVLLTYQLLPHRWQNRLLLLASYIFYGSWDWRFLPLILVSTLVDFYCGAAMYSASSPKRRKQLLTVSLAVNLGLLGTFKYLGFFVDSFIELADSVGMHVNPVSIQIILPVGISFYTFQTLSYTIDIYHRRLEPEPRFLNFALFVAFFPQLVAGPIERASRLLPQIRMPRRITMEQLADAAWLMLWGYFLKIFVADNLAPVADRLFAMDTPPDSLDVLLGLYAFAFQIFGDFAGYSSIAIGVARLFGISLSTNFLFPYFVTNPRDFWHNWHISLSTWLRDYLYIPLGGNRGSALATYRSLFLTMLLGGLWHGAAWTYVLWGAYQGLLLIGHRLILKISGPAATPPGTPLAYLWTLIKVAIMFHLTCFGWLIFRATSVEQALDMFQSIFTGIAWPTVTSSTTALELLFYCVPMLLVQLLQLAQMRKQLPLLAGNLPEPVRIGAMVCMIDALLIWGNYGGEEFIYFQF